METQAQFDPAKEINDAVRGIFQNAQPALIIGAVVILAVMLGFISSGRRR